MIKQYLPNLLSGFRLALVPALFYFAFNGYHRIFLVCLAASLLSDLADGLLARRLLQTSELGAKLDSWGDLATYVSLPICAWWLWPDLMRQEAAFVFAAIVSFLVPLLFGFVKYRRVTSYHTWGNKLSAGVMGCAVLLFFGGGMAWAFRTATVVLVVAELEETIITLILPKWRSDVPSVWNAWKLRRERGDQEPKSGSKNPPRAIG